MISPRLSRAVLAVWAAWMAPCCNWSQSSGTWTVTPANPETVPCFGILEISFRHNGQYKNNFLDAGVTVQFTAPDGRVLPRKGFYYGRGVWMVRFSPDQPGAWKYVYTFKSARFEAAGDGRFYCASREASGPLRRDASSPYRFLDAGGRTWFPLGLQDCVSNDGPTPSSFFIDGELRNDNRARKLSPSNYFKTYRQAGFNLFRFSQKNCSYPIFIELDLYREDESLATDELISAARQNGFRVLFGIFGYHARWTDGTIRNRLISFVRHKTGLLPEAVDDPSDLSVLNAEKRFIDYCVARWGVYADFWELLNERQASDEWTRLMAAYLHSVDPDHKPVGTSWEKPALPNIDLNTPHWYESEDELASDSRVRELATAWKAFGKPVILGEQGNTGMNWDPRSGLRLRLRAWTALFQEIGLVFWNTSWSKYGMWQGRYAPGKVANIYLGVEERGYTRVLAEFTSRLDAGLQMAPVTLSAPDRVRAYGLSSPTQTAAYFHHFAMHDSPVQDLVITLPAPSAAGRRLRVAWIDPADGKEKTTFLIRAHSATLKAPPFVVDLAVLIQPAPP